MSEGGNRNPRSEGRRERNPNQPITSEPAMGNPNSWSEREREDLSKGWKHCSRTIMSGHGRGEGCS